MKQHMDGGFVHGGSPGNEELAIFCTSCPQPGINVKDHQDPETTWALGRSYVADGCFSQVHQLSRCDDDVALQDGQMYMTESTRYSAHLATAIERKDVRTLPGCSSVPIHVIHCQPTANDLQ